MSVSWTKRRRLRAPGRKWELRSLKCLLRFSIPLRKRPECCLTYCVCCVLQRWCYLWIDSPAHNVEPRVGIVHKVLTPRRALEHLMCDQFISKNLVLLFRIWPRIITLISTLKQSHFNSTKKDYEYILDGLVNGVGVGNKTPWEHLSFFGNNRL